MSDEGMSEPAMMTPDEIARAYLKSTIENKRAHLDKCTREVSAFMAADDVNLATFTRRWESARVEAETTLRVYETLRDLVANGDEYREQHENLLSVRQSDLTALTARATAAERERDRLYSMAKANNNLVRMMTTERKSLREAATKAADQFGFYVTEHRAKGTPASYAKAATNEQMRDMLLAALTANHSAPVVEE